jgi:PhnB protein
MQTQVYLFFEGRTEEALDFYKKTLGIEVEMLMRFKDAPKEAQAGMVAGSENKVMHSSFKLGDQHVMASDGHCGGTAEFKGFSLALSVKDGAEAEKVFGALSDGGQVRQPLIQTFFSPKFGVLQDKFGVGWMVLVSQGSRA